MKPLNRFEHISVLGAGAWGTALAMNAHLAMRKVSVWTRQSTIAASLSAGEGNPSYLPGIALPPLHASTDMNILEAADAILAVIPAQHARAGFAMAAPFIKPGTPVLLCAKGIEQDSLNLMTEVLAQSVPHAIPAVLSGPSFAHDVARNLPTAVTLACKDEALGRDLVAALGRPMFRPYWTHDLIGAEIGGAIKNVLAIACGITEGLQLGRSAHAALISRGFAEMQRLGVALGAEEKTLSGLCGLGDLVLTCSSTQSRNMSFGKALGEGGSVADILASRTSVTEGVATTPAILTLAARHSVELPICSAVGAILDGTLSVKEAITTLLARPFKEES